MIELFLAYKIMENYNKKENFINDLDSYDDDSNVPVSWIIMALIISFGSAYIAYCCNQYEKPATRALSTIIAFFFSGFYLIYYFIVHVMFDRKCSSRGINNIIKNISKK
jgi:uncharacterized protein YybS (DUF2232 family)